jgi:hypothetical protein
LELEELKTRSENQNALYENAKANEAWGYGILEKFISTMNNDLLETQEEIREDKGERRDDQREHKETKGTVKTFE